MKTIPSESTQKTNRLIDEKSPYLQQHAHNPVDWYPWGEEAFSQAVKDNKPIFLSIGYSTCHWCHVMEKESFEDEDVARLMNDAFISIKVDREERPDIDKVYMQVAQMMTGRGGWPLTIIMTPQKEPFFAATYIPKENRYGNLGLMELIPSITSIWKTDKKRIKDITEQIKDAFQKSKSIDDSVQISISEIESAVKAFSDRFDDTHGGFGRSPKFPSPHNLLLLLRWWKRTNDDMPLHMVEKTLRKMKRGGVFDHIGFGFHRYSTDREWILPHFEKMLYDQAMLLHAYSEAYQVTKNPEYVTVMNKIVEYVMRDLLAPEGAFFSAEDADSEGEEGKFYTWKMDELQKILTKRELNAFVQVYNIREKGNFNDEATSQPTGNNIPYLSYSLQTNAKTLKMPLEDLKELLEKARRKLFEERKKRIRPLRDEKILTDWNGLMIGALAKASRVLNNSDYEEAAENAMAFILEMMDDDGCLLHRYKDGERIINAFLDDYAFTVWGLIELYETTFRPKYLKMARNLHSQMIDMFWDEDDGGFFFTSLDSEELLVRQKDAYDGAIPSGNSIALFNTIRLARLLGDSNLEQKASHILRTFYDEVVRVPTGFSMMLLAAEFAIGPSYELVLAGEENSPDLNAMIKAIRNQYIPNKVVLVRAGDDQAKEITELAPYTRYHNPVQEKATAHVCTEQNCKLPTNEISQMLALLGFNNQS